MLKNLKFVLEGKKIDKAKLKAKIAELGGKVTSTVSQSVAAVIADEGKRAKLFSLNGQIRVVLA